MKAIIVDDEALARARIAALLIRTDIIVVGHCSSGKAAISAVNEHRPDIVFLDVDLKDMMAFEVIKGFDVTCNPFIVLVTAHERYALKAFEYEALDFLCKPFKEERFFKCLSKIRKARGELGHRFQRLPDPNKIFEQPVHIQKIPVKQGNRTSLINISEIRYTLASGYYAEIFTGEKKYLIRNSLSNLIRNLDQKVFVRIHRSAIVNVDYIQEIIHSSYAEIDVKMKDNRIIRISKSKKKDFLSRLGILQ